MTALLALVTALAFHPGGKLLVAGGYKQVLVWDLAGGRLRRPAIRFRQRRWQRQSLGIGRQAVEHPSGGGSTVKRLLLLMPLVIGAQQSMLEPPQPVLAWIYPAGGQRGTTVEVTASGTAIAPDAEPGVRELRILNAGGVSNRSRFVVGQLPEIDEVEPNSEKSQAQNIASWPVVNGQILEGDRDYFRFSAKAGETVICAVEARSRRLENRLPPGNNRWKLVRVCATIL